jgi:hypothetical protein
MQIKNKDFCRIVGDGTAVEFAPMMLDTPTVPTAEEYLAQGWLKNAIVAASPAEGYAVASTRYEAQDGAISAVYGYAPIPPRVRRWTPLSIKRAASTLGYWDDLKAMLSAAGAYDDFIMAHVEVEDDPDFAKILTAARAQFGDAVASGILDAAVEE